MSSYPEARPRKDYYDVVDIFSLGSLRVAELSNGKFVVLTPEEYQQARQGVFQHYAADKHPESGYTLDQLVDSAAGVQGRETYSESVSYKHGKAESFEARGKGKSILEVFSDNNAVLTAYQDGIDVWENTYGHREVESFLMEFSPDMKSCELLLLRNLGKHGNAIEKEGFFLCGVVDFKKEDIWSWVQKGLYENPMWGEMEKLKDEEDSPLFKTMLKTYEKKLEEIGFKNPRMDYYQEEGAFEMKFDSYTPVDFTSYEWGDVYVKDISEDGVTFQQQCLISGITRRGYSDVKLEWGNPRFRAESFHSENDFPLDITHDDIEYYLLERLEDGSEEIGVYHTDITDAPDPVLHLYLDEAQEKASESFESEPSYSLSAELSRGVRPMSKNNMMMSMIALGGAAFVGFYFDRIVAMFRSGNGEEQAAESIQSAANQGFMENWQGGNSGSLADDPRMETKTMQGAVESEPQVKYDYNPYAGPSQVFHDEATRQKDYFVY